MHLEARLPDDAHVVVRQADGFGGFVRDDLSLLVREAWIPEGHGDGCVADRVGQRPKDDALPHRLDDLSALADIEHRVADFG